MASLIAKTRFGSDHTPLLLDFGEGSKARSTRFCFETSWFAVPGFPDLIKQSWEKCSRAPG
jgi:hypothetical protein